MNKKAFTIIEIIAVVIIVSILATLGLPMYQNIIESSKDQVCATNLETLGKAVDIYITEHDTVPGSLAELDPGQIETAYAQVMQGKGAWKKKLAAWIVKVNQPKNLAYAQITGGPYGLPQLHCPCDRSGSGSSYEINNRDIKTALDYGNFKKTNPNIALVGDAFHFGTGLAGPSNFAYLVHYLETKQRGHKRYGFAGSNTKYYLLGISVTGQVGVALTDSMTDLENFFLNKGCISTDLYKSITGKSGSPDQGQCPR